MHFSEVNYFNFASIFVVIIIIINIVCVCVCDCEQCESLDVHVNVVLRCIALKFLYKQRRHRLKMLNKDFM